jgi:hypothetical protein
LPAARRPELAARQRIEALGSVTSCVTTRRLEFSPRPFAAEEPISGRFLEPVSLRSPDGGPSGLFLAVSTLFVSVPMEEVELPRRWLARTQMYEYRLLDHDYTELLVYHWQPSERYAGPDEPHLHVSASLRAKVDAVTTRSIALDKLHIATGQVSLATIIRMLITEFGIAPQRSDWRETLEQVEPAS